MRRYADTIEVRSATEGTGEPTSFLWRGRLYVVRDVLGHWRERRSWWSSPAARRVHGDASPEAEAEAEAGPAVGRDPAAATGPVGGALTAAVRVADLAQEREVWRVCASPGRTYAGGVYDLCRDPAEASTPSRGSPGEAWHLVRVAD